MRCVLLLQSKNILGPGDSFDGSICLLVFSASERSAAAAAKAHGVVPEKAYWDAEALARDPDVDLVVVSVKVFDDLIITSLWLATLLLFFSMCDSGLAT